MDYRRLFLLILVAGSSFVGGACSKANLGIPPTSTTALIDKQSEDTRPLYFVNNIEVQDYKQAKINPNDIKSINVLKPSSPNDLISIYGLKAKNGIIFITTKSRK